MKHSHHHAYVAAALMMTLCACPLRSRLGPLDPDEAGSSGNTSSSSGGTVITDPADEEFAPPQIPNTTWMNVRDLGAVGDGIADDTAAFQQALNTMLTDTYRMLYVPAGTYKITATLQIPGHPPPEGWWIPEQSRIVGEDPATTVITWGGAAGQHMVWIDAQPYSAWERLTFDGANVASEGFHCEWTMPSGPDTWMMFRDLTFKRLEYGIRSLRNNHRMFAEVFIKRCQFQDISKVGVETASANNQNWFVWHSRFERCAVGAACDGYRELAVYESSFVGSTDTDLRGITAARGCWSSGSKAFFRAVDHPIDPQIVLQGNRIIDPVDTLAVDLTGGGSWMIHLLDNVIRSREDVTTGPVMATGGAKLLAVGNRATVSNAFRWGGDTGNVFDNITVERSTVDGAEPPRPPTAPNRNRKTFSITATGNHEPLQEAIDQAVAWEAANPGSRPIVFLQPGLRGLSLGQTIIIPAGTDIQIMGYASINTYNWQGTNEALIEIRGPTRVSMDGLMLVGDPSRGGRGSVKSVLLLKDVDQVGSRLIMEDVIISNSKTLEDGSKRRGLVVDRANNIRVEALSWFSGMVHVIDGGKDERAGTYLFGASNVVSNPAYEMENGGRLVVQEAYSELFDNLGAGPQHATLYCHGSSLHPGAVTLEIYGNNASEETKAADVYLLDGWKGFATFLTGSYWSGLARMKDFSDDGNGMAVLSVATNFPRLQDPLLSQSRVLQTGCGYPVVRHNVRNDEAFVLEGLAQRRAAVPTPQPLQPVPVSASDIQLRRLHLWGGIDTAILVRGSGG